MLLLGVITALFACTKEVTLDLGEVPEKLVIEGNLQVIDGSLPEVQRLKLSLLGDFFKNEEPSPATGAEVWVEDELGNRYTYTETPGGIYECNTLTALTSDNYDLHIIWQAQEYLASEVMSPVSEIEGIYQIFEEESLFEDGGIKVAIDFTDPEGQENYYYWETWIDGEQFMLPDPGNNQSLIASDEFFDGNQIVGYLPNSESVVTPGQEVLIRQIGISKNAFDYYFLLFDQTGRTGQLVDTPPAPVRGNIRNLSDPENHPLGYFSVNQVSEKRIVITEN